MLPSINENQADFVLSLVKNGLNDLISHTELNENKDSIKFTLQPDLIEKFSNKFPDANLVELDNVVTWILYKSMMFKKENDG